MKRWPFWLVVVTCLGCGMLAGLILARLAPAHLLAASVAETKVAPVVPRRIIPPDDGKLHIICFGAHAR